jgi:predicted small integral membrane protein
VVKIIPTPNGEAEAQQDRKEREEKASQGQWTIRLAWAVAIATFLQAIFLFFTLMATKKAANGAINSANVAKETLTSTQRAFVSVSGTQHTEIFTDQPPQFMKINVRWYNSGTTPTKHLISNINWHFFPDNLPINFDYPSSSKLLYTCIGPKTGIHSDSVDIPINIIDGHNRIYLWGWADYNDIFPNTPRHRTEFCFEVIVNWKDKILQFRPHYKYNGADDECYRKPSPYTLPT